ncbi:hypothetical protein UFOVP116_400 [uncultured Caudovirales phage]|uniref:Uncharacterized protein n=1 Tax=uncultured Caudovirales phage TaxID=2100421 RepID=A0A6J5LBR8_9CAUD|nr:hypothetical protein UFOVP116_400 [uncultured Caudovirales phage]
MSDYNEIQHNSITGHIKIFDPTTNEVLVDKYNAIHFENISEALAQSISNKNSGFIHEMHFGNGGTSVDPTGIISYLPTNNKGQSADLYNKTYYKVVDDLSSLNNDPTRNKITVRHQVGARYTDIMISCMLDYGEPAGQTAFDNSENLDGDFVFDELGLKSWTGTAGTGKLLTHVIFHPVQKSLNRLIQIDYTVRIQTLTTLSSTT